MARSRAVWLVDARAGRPRSDLEVGLIARPAASASIRLRLADAAAAMQG